MVDTTIHFPFQDNRIACQWFEPFDTYTKLALTVRRAGAKQIARHAATKHPEFSKGHGIRSRSVEENNMRWGRKY